MILLINLDHDKALSVVEDALAEYPDEYLLQRTKFLCNLTDKNCCVEVIDGPLELINSLIEAKPDDLELSVMKALLYMMTNNYKEGKDWIKGMVEFNLLKRNPRVDTVAYLILSFSYLARGKFEKALDIVNKIKFHYANHPLSHIIAGFVHGFNIVYKFDASKADKNLFVEGFEKAISMEPSEKHLSRYYQLYSYILNETNGTVEALVEIEKAIELEPLDANLYDTYGEVLMISKNYKGAIEKFTQALEANPRGWFAFHTFIKLAQSYKHLGMRVEAATCYTKAKMLTEKVIPGKRKLYIDQLQENFDDFYPSQD